MSHFTVLVIGDDVEGQLAPFDENGEWGRDGSHWDWWQIGGRWTGYFKLKPKAKGNVGRPGLMTSAAPNGHCDQCLKRDVDFEGMIVDRREKAENNWNEAANVRATFASAETENSRKVALRDLYWNHGIETKAPDHLTLESHDEYVARCTTVSTFAVVKEGKWYQRGKMGWWANVSNEKDKGGWEKEFSELLSSVENDTLLTLVDCHV